MLKSVYDDSDDITGSVEWADIAVTMAEAFLADGRLETESYFKAAFGRLDQTLDPPAELRMRACERRAHYLFSVLKRPLSAKPFCEEARTLAVRHGSPEDVARAQLRLLHIELNADNDPQYDNFQSIMRVGNEDEFTSREILRAWTIHVGQLEGKMQGLRYARKATNAVDAYFQKLLIESRSGGNSDEFRINGELFGS